MAQSDKQNGEDQGASNPGIIKEESALDAKKRSDAQWKQLGMLAGNLAARSLACIYITADACSHDAARAPTAAKCARNTRHAPYSTRRLPSGEKFHFVK